MDSDALIAALRELHRQADALATAAHEAEQAAEGFRALVESAATLDALGLAADAEGPEPDLGAGPIHESPSYRASLRDAGRGRLLP